VFRQALGRFLRVLEGHLASPPCQLTQVGHKVTVVVVKRVEKYRKGISAPAENISHFLGAFACIATSRDIRPTAQVQRIARNSGSIKDSKVAHTDEAALQDVTLASTEMTNVHSFSIEPVARFAGLNAGIRRPKVRLLSAKIIPC
jgi:hypothetical protein